MKPPTILIGLLALLRGMSIVLSNLCQLYLNRMAFARKHKTFSTSHSTIIITITFYIHPCLTPALLKYLLHSLLCHSLSVSPVRTYERTYIRIHIRLRWNVLWLLFHIFFSSLSLLLFEWKTKLWNYSIKSSNSVNAPRIHDSITCPKNK